MYSSIYIMQSLFSNANLFCSDIIPELEGLVRFLLSPHGLHMVTSYFCDCDQLSSFEGASGNVMDFVP